MKADLRNADEILAEERTSWAWWHMTLNPSTWETEAEEPPV